MNSFCTLHEAPPRLRRGDQILLDQDGWADVVAVNSCAATVAIKEERKIETANKTVLVRGTKMFRISANAAGSIRRRGQLL